MLTEHQSELFSKLIDASWEADDTANSPLTRDLARNEYWRLKKELMDDIGTEAYLLFVARGKQMFA
jgi:hypothetical protein